MSPPILLIPNPMHSLLNPALTQVPSISRGKQIIMILSGLPRHPLSMTSSYRPFHSTVTSFIWLRGINFVWKLITSFLKANPLQRSLVVSLDALLVNSNSRPCCSSSPPACHKHSSSSSFKRQPNWCKDSDCHVPLYHFIRSLSTVCM